MKKYYGKEKCRILKTIRAEIARQNDIEWVVSECSHKGDCRGTCPKCEQEVRQLEAALARREALGKTIAVAGISAGLALSVAGCANPFATQGDMQAPSSSGIYPATNEQATETETEPWVPDRIARAQCFGMHGNFFTEKNSAKEWIKASRDWQREALKYYVHMLRRRVDYIESTAVHLLIDAWPMGWTKTLVDVERIPKPAYYSFKEANILTRVDLRRDKYVVYENDLIPTEIYAFNDRPMDKAVEVKVSVYLDGKEVESYTLKDTAKAVSANYLGEIHTRLPGVKSGNLKIVAAMECDGEVTYDSVDYVIKPKITPASFTPEILGERVSSVKNLCSGEISDRVIIADCDYFRAHQDELEAKANSGSRLVIFMDKPLNVIGDDVIFFTHEDDTECGSKNLVLRSETSPFTAEFDEYDFKNFYNADLDFQEVTARYRFNWNGSEEILYVYDAKNPSDRFHKLHINVAAKKNYGEGEVILTTLHTVGGCIGHNPVLDKFIINLIEK